MLRRLTIPEVICAGVLCLFAIGSASAADTAERARKNEYKATVARADADYKAAKDACKAKPSAEKKACLKDAKAAHENAEKVAKANYKAAKKS